MIGPGIILDFRHYRYNILSLYIYIIIICFAEGFLFFFKESKTKLHEKYLHVINWPANEG